MAALYIGLMSGTSADSIDAALLRLKPDLQVLATHSHPMPVELRQQIRDLDADSPLRLVAELDVKLGRLFAAAVQGLLATAGISATAVRAIGSHGQTIWHAPDGELPFTLQIGDPNVIAELTGIATVADFRRRDIAAGGQGAPLVPAFHQEIFAAAGSNCCVLNLGGIANVTILEPSGGTGFDTGPANTLLDSWIQACHGLPFDADGAWAASGMVLPELLETLLQDPYFARSAPKSTGPEYFSLTWLRRYLGNQKHRPQDVQATLVELTAHSVSRAIRDYAPMAGQVLVCGGGVHNSLLMKRLAALLTPMPVQSTITKGIDPDFIEACAFAWLAHQRLQQRPGNLPAATGAVAPVVLGGIYAARL